MNNAYRRIAILAVGLACWWTCLRALRSGVEGPWYVLDRVMTFTEDPPFNHRILFVLVAKLFRFVVPGLVVEHAFVLSQAVALGLALLLVYEWGKLFVGAHLRFLAPVLLSLMLIPTFGHYTFYDVGVVATNTAGLLCLERKRVLPFLVVFILGTLNHEISLLMLAYLWAGRKHLGWGMGKSAQAILVGVLVYGAIRAALFGFLPASAAWEGIKLQYNLELLLTDHRAIGYTVLAVGPWYVLAFLGYQTAPNWLRRCVVVVPPLVGITALFGQFSEARQFDSLIPLVLGFVLCWIRTEESRLNESRTG